MSRHPNFAKLANAHILEWTAHHTLESFGYPALHTVFKDKEYLVNGERKSFYLEMGAETREAYTQANRVAYLIAKYLLLNGSQPTYCATITELKSEVMKWRSPREMEPNEKLQAVTHGKGYLVVPDFFANHFVLTEDIVAPDILREIGDCLAAHVYDGGGLVLVGSPMSHPGLQHFGSLSDTFGLFEKYTMRAKDQA